MDEAYIFHIFANMKSIALIIFFSFALLPCKAQSKMSYSFPTDSLYSHTTDSTMMVLKGRYGNKQSWRNINQNDSARSVVILRPEDARTPIKPISTSKDPNQIDPNSVYGNEGKNQKDDEKSILYGAVEALRSLVTK